MQPFLCMQQPLNYRLSVGKQRMQNIGIRAVVAILLHSLFELNHPADHDRMQPCFIGGYLKSSPCRKIPLWLQD